MMARSPSLSLFPRGGGVSLLSRVRRSLSLASLSLSLPTEGVLRRRPTTYVSRRVDWHGRGTAFPLAEETDRQQQKGAAQEE
jgi:hypothetical protein